MLRRCSGRARQADEGGIQPIAPLYVGLDTVSRLRRSSRRWWPLQPGVALLAFSTLALLETPFALARQADWGYTWSRLKAGDFGEYYLMAQIGLHHGWNRLYDVAAQRQEWLAFGGPNGAIWWPDTESPLQAWFAAPFGLLPWSLAFTCWMALIAGALLLTWRLVAPGQGLARWTALAVALAAYPVMYALMLGQAVILVAASVAAGWWLLRRGHQLAAGAVLVLILLKPHLALLVPLALLVAGYRRAFLAWAVGAATVAIVAVLSLGADGISLYFARIPEALAAARDWAPASLSVSQSIGTSLPARVIELVLVVVTLRTVWLQRRRGPDTVVAVGVLGSMILTPYVHIPDLAMLLLAGAIFLHAEPTLWQRRLLIALYVALVAILWTPWPLRLLLGGLLVLLEVVWLASLYVVRPARPERATAVAA